MAHYRTSVRTPWSPEQAFDFMSDLENFPAWDPGTKRAVCVAGTAGEADAAYDLTVKGVTDTVMRYEVVAFDRPSRVEARSTTGVLESVDVITVAPDRPARKGSSSTGSIVTYEADLRLRGLLRLADPILGLVFGRIGDRAAEGLRVHLAGEFVR